MPPTDTTWPLQAAKDQFSQLVKAAAHAPQSVTVHGRPAAVVLSPQAYARLLGATRRSLSKELLRPGLLGPEDDELFSRQASADEHRDVKL